MKRFLLVSICLVLVCLGFTSCGKKIEMEESKTYHFEGYDLSFAVPKGWKVDQATENFEKGPVNFISIMGVAYTDDINYVAYIYYITPPASAVQNRIPDFDKKIYKKYGDYYIYMPSTHPPMGGLYIEDDKSFGFYFFSVAKAKITPELEAIFNSFKIEKIKTDSSNKDI